MSSGVFGTDGARGKVGVWPITDPGYFEMAAAYGTLLNKYADHEAPSVNLGYDPRKDSEHFADAAVAGFLSVGVSVRRIGIITTPGLSYLTRESDVDGAGMLTASHNAEGDHGFKLLWANGRKLPDSIQDDIEIILKDGVPEYRRRSAREHDGSGLVVMYEDFLVSSVGKAVNFNGLKVGLDMANGSTMGIATRVLRRLGANVTPFFDDPNGIINQGCGATHMEFLQQAVVDNGHDVGFAFDGDGDRGLIVDPTGEILDGDDILHILTKLRLEKGVVTTIMSNLGFRRVMKAAGIQVKLTSVGDRYVLDGMEETGYNIGGEQSGHVILAEKLKTGDGILSVLETLLRVRGSKQDFAQWRKSMPRVPQKIVNIPSESKHALAANPKVVAIIQKEIDILGEDGIVSVRPSGTEKCLRVTVQSDDAEERAVRLAASIQAAA